MYQDHFGLSRPPFKITPDTSLFFEGNQRGAALDALTYAIKSGEGIIKVVGEVGSGKTMLCRMLEVRLNNEVDVVYIANPSLSPDNILHVIAHELHLDVDNLMSKVDVMQKIQAHLLSKHAGNRQVVLFVEEAQSMPIETLEEIRLLSNLETDENKLLQMVLFGQPELDEKLSLKQIRQLKERITHSFNLSPFRPDDTLQYLNFRLRAVGYRGPDIFTKKTAAVVKKYSNGLTRRINIIADKAMLVAFSENSHAVTVSHIKSAAVDSEFRKQSDNKKYIWMLAAILVVMAALYAGFYAGQQNTGIKTFGDKRQSITLLEKVTESASVPEKEVIVAAARTEVSVGPEIVEPQTLSANIILREETEQVLNDMASRSDIAGKLKKTTLWLADASDSSYSIQLFMARASNADELEDFLRNMPEMLDFTKIYIYETVISGHPWYGVVYDEFGSSELAMEVLINLPESLKASNPYLRRVRALRKDATRRI